MKPKVGAFHTNETEHYRGIQINDTPNTLYVLNTKKMNMKTRFLLYASDEAE